MARIFNMHTAPLTLPGPSVVLGGVELQPGPGGNVVDDAAWSAAQASPMVQKWAELGLLVVEAPKKTKG